MKPRSIVRALIRSARRSLHRRPRIVMTLLCRDEEDIVGYNIAHHLAQGVDYVIATDNSSRDRTPLLLERFARQGKLHLIREPSLTHDQGTWVTRMARMAVDRLDADWVINSDALAVPTFDMVPPCEHRSMFFEAMVVRFADGRSVHGTSFTRKACHRAYGDVRVAEGNHHVKRGDTLMPQTWDHPLHIVHFPIRSPVQFERKIRQGAEALRANPRLHPTISRHWRRLYDDYYMQGRLNEYYDERAPTRQQIRVGLADGLFVVDTRIRDTLRAVDAALAEPGMPIDGDGEN